MSAFEEEAAAKVAVAKGASSKVAATKEAAAKRAADKEETPHRRAAPVLDALNLTPNVGRHHQVVTIKAHYYVPYY